MTAPHQVCCWIFSTCSLMCDLVRITQNDASSILLAFSQVLLRSAARAAPCLARDELFVVGPAQRGRVVEHLGAELVRHVHAGHALHAAKVGDVAPPEIARHAQRVQRVVVACPDAQAQCLARTPNDSLFFWMWTLGWHASVRMNENCMQAMSTTRCLLDKPRTIEEEQVTQNR